MGDGFTCKAYGNIMSLLDEENFATKTDLPNQKFVFYGLFYGNTALTDASTLLLPATTLAESCYFEMFNGCSALTAAPALPATTLVQTCYDRMFNGCSNLSSVTCLATEGINQNNSTSLWLDGVAASGTFTAATDATWPEGVNGIPSGWTRKNPDGSTYPRPLAEATADDKGKIAGADGKIYDTKADATAAGITAVAMIIYVGSETDNTTYTHGLALALADEGGSSRMNWSTAKSTCEGKTAVSGAAWLLPSRNQWNTMISAAGSYTALRDGFSSVGGANLREVGYWSSTMVSSYSPTDNVWAYYFSSGKWFGIDDVDDWAYVRACLVF